MSVDQAVTELGSGMLNWHRYERVGDRYGSVGLWPDREGDPSIDYYLHGDDEPLDTFADAPVGARGELRAEVVRNRKSGHIGDLFRGLRPPDTPPAPGTVLTLGEGTLFVESKGDDGPYVGLEPDDGRDNDWLDPKVLYTLHEQTVRLFFVSSGME